MTNKTTKYLYPAIKLHPIEFKSLLYSLEIKNVFACDNDYYYTWNIFEVKNYLFLVVDKNGAFDKDKGLYKDINKGQRTYKETITQLRNYDMVITDYVLENSNHVIVIAMPDSKFNREDYTHNHVKLFLKGEFSKLYTEEELEIIFPSYSNPNFKVQSEHNQQIRGILQKKKEAAEYFKGVIKTQLGLDLRSEDLDEHTGEYDIMTKYSLGEEVINYTDTFKLLVGLEDKVKI